MLFNFAIATRIMSRNGQRPPAAKLLPIFGLLINLTALGYFKSRAKNPKVHRSPF